MYKPKFRLYDIVGVKRENEIIRIGIIKKISDDKIYVQPYADVNNVLVNASVLIRLPPKKSVEYVDENIINKIIEEIKIKGV